MPQVWSQYGTIKQVNGFVNITQRTLSDHVEASPTCARIGWGKEMRIRLGFIKHRGASGKVRGDINRGAQADTNKKPFHYFTYRNFNAVSS